MKVRDLVAAFVNVVKRKNATLDTKGYGEYITAEEQRDHLASVLPRMEAQANLRPPKVSELSERKR